MKQDLNQYIAKEKFYKDVVEDGSDVIFVVDFDLNILYHNPSVRKTMGYNTLVGENLLEFIHPKVKQPVKEAFEISKSHPYNSNIEFKFLCNDDSYKYLEFNSINLKFKDGIEGLILDCRDVSQRKRDQEELISAQKAKEQFLANMSHEIRTPINGIVGMVNLLLDSTPTAEQSKHLHAIKHSADNLKVIINDILDFSIIESGKLKFEHIGFDVVYQAQSVIDSLMVQAMDKGLAIELDYSKELKNMVLLGDPVRLNQILINLINNSIKFTHEGKITVSISCAKSLEGLVNITVKVKDTGIGIAADKIKTIFDTFKQADESITRKFGGTGLGLTISKQLIELQGGKISVESTLGKGTTFTFVIPYEQGSKKDIIEQTDVGAKTLHAHKPTAALRAMRILLVEDNDINRMYASTILKKWHCQVSQAENGQIALEKLRKQDFDMILMDIHMPILDGIEASRSIRTTFPKPKCDVPIIAFTANALKGDRTKYLDAGMNSYISKPFMPEELYKIITKYYTPKEDKDNRIDKLTNLANLRKMSNNDETFIREMISTFCNNTPSILEEMQKALDNKNWQAVGDMAHKIKPNLAFMGIDSLKEPILEIEHSGREEKNIDTLPKKVETLISKVNDAIEELKNF